MTDKEREELADKFVEILKEIGIKKIEDIPVSFKLKKEHKDFWIIK